MALSIGRIALGACQITTADPEAAAGVKVASPCRGETMEIPTNGRRTPALEGLRPAALSQEGAPLNPESILQASLSGRCAAGQRGRSPSGASVFYTAFRRESLSPRILEQASHGAIRPRLAALTLRE